MPLKFADALCLIFTYNFGDCSIFKKTNISHTEAIRLLKINKISAEDGSAVSDAYTKLVEETAEDILPDGWETTFDYWGGKCYAYHPSWNAPKKETLMAGENYGYLCCTSLEAIKEELAKCKEFDHAVC